MNKLTLVEALERIAKYPEKRGDELSIESARQLARTALATQATPTTNEREAFEAWYQKVYACFGQANFHLNSYGEYFDDDIEASWCAWQAALASQAQQPTAYRVIASANGEVVRDSLEFTRMSEIDEKVVRQVYDLEIIPLYSQQPNHIGDSTKMAKPITCTDSAREFLVENLLPKFSDSTFSVYVRSALAGDFAYQLATYLQSQTQQPISIEKRANLAANMVHYLGATKTQAKALIDGVIDGEHTISKSDLLPQPQQRNIDIQEAVRETSYVFKDSCDHTKQAIDYMKVLLDIQMSKTEPAKKFCKECASFRSGDKCHKCGGDTFTPDERFTEQKLPPIEEIRKIAREAGYAVAVHGTQERDLDVIAAPWTEDAVGNHELMERIANGINAVILETERKPLGRYAATIQIDGWYKPLDLSVCPRLPTQEGDNK